MRWTGVGVVAIYLGTYLVGRSVTPISSTYSYKHIGVAYMVHVDCPTTLNAHLPC